MKNTATRVIFRKMDNNGEIIALFPDILGTSNPETCLSYAHQGQHSSADYRGMIQTSTQASPEEHNDLRRELETIGYTIQTATARVKRQIRPHAYHQQPRKYRYLLVIQHSYIGEAWEDCATYDTADAEEKKTARIDLKEYRASSRPGDGSRYRLINRREKIGE